MKTRKLLELALELGDTPDAIHPTHKQSLQTGSHGLGKNPAFPAHQGAGMNPHERHALGTYKSIATNLQRYGGYLPRSQNPREVMRAAQDMMQTLEDLQQREEAHRDALERLAVETVFRLPEFKRLRKDLDTGHVKIEAFLNRRIEIQGMQSTDDEREQPAEFEVPEIKAEYDEMVHKRKMINTLIQGTAVSNNYSFAYYSRDELNAIDPTLVQDYGKLMAYSELGYFIQDPEMVKMAAQAGGTESQGGEERLKRNDDGSISILARGISFPILVQEVIKGIMEYISWNDEEDPATQQQVNREADFVEDEQVQMQVGPNIYRQMVDAIGQESVDVWPYLHDELVKMPTGEFNQRMQGLIGGTPEGRAWFKQLAMKIKQEIAADEEAGPQESLVKRMCS
jgi:hypothetical protein